MTMGRTAGTTLTVRVSETERARLDGYAALHGMTAPDALKAAFFEKLEDELDMEAVRDYERTGAKERRYSFNEALVELGLAE